jgi:uncharacterized protein (TIGR02646 family)
VIRYKRRRDDEHGVRIQPNAAWFTSAKQHTGIALKEKSAHQANGAVYHHIEVHKALEKLFHRKCAYCESFPTGTAAWDVEHFRPKAHYYWLSYEWTNLYLSCSLCNQARKDLPTWDEPTSGPSAGKLDQFPLTGTYRASMPADQLSKEKRLLVDPCADDPTKHVTFDIVGQAVAVGASKKGNASIDVFNLNRKRLRTDRRAMIEGHLKAVRQYTPAFPVATVLDNLVKAYGTDNMPFAGTVRAIQRDPAAFGL